MASEHDFPGGFAPKICKKKDIFIGVSVLDMFFWLKIGYCVLIFVCITRFCVCFCCRATQVARGLKLENGGK